MARIAAVLLSFLALPLFAQTADLGVTLQAPPTTRPGEQYTFKGIVENRAGVSIDRDAINVAFNGNSFQANGSLAIDRGHEGPVSGSPIPVPLITSVRVEDGTTIIEGTVDPAATGTFAPRVQLYANTLPIRAATAKGSTSSARC